MYVLMSVLWLRERVADVRRLPGGETVENARTPRNAAVTCLIHAMR